MEFLLRDDNGRIQSVITECDFSKTTTSYEYNANSDSPYYILTRWEDKTHKVIQEHEEFFQVINGLNLLVTERICYLDDNDNLIDYHECEYFYDKNGDIVMIQEQDNEEQATYVGGFSIKNILGERICSVSKIS